MSFDPRYDDHPSICAEDGCSRPVCDQSRELCAQHEIVLAIDNGDRQRAYDLADDNGISSTYVDQVIAAAMVYAARIARNKLAANTVLATIARAS